MSLRGILTAIFTTAALLGGCSPEVEIADVCSDLDEASCDEDGQRRDANCLYEQATDTCLQLCRGGAECPDGFVCVESDNIEKDGGLAIATFADVCRPE